MLFYLAVTDLRFFFFFYAFPILHVCVCACSPYGMCQSSLLFLNELHWEMRALLIQSPGGGTRGVSHTHRRKRNFLFIPHFRTSKMYTLAGCSRTNKDSGRYVLTSAHSSTAASLPRMSANTSILIKSSETERGREGGRRRVQPVGKKDVKGRNRQMARGKVEFVLARYAQK